MISKITKTNYSDVYLIFQKLFGLGVAIAISSCAQIEHKTQIHQQVNEVLTVGIGDKVFSSRTEKSLPNVFGKADLFGRTTPTETTKVIYVGTTGGQAVFLRTTVSIETGATTMNSSPLVLNNRSTTTYSGSIDGKSYYGRSSTSEPPTIIVPNTPEPNYVDGGTHKISLNIDKLPVSFVVLGTTITVLEAKQYSARVILNN